MNTRRDTISDTQITLACFSLLVITAILYLYFLNVSVVHVVMRKEAAQEIQTLHTEIAALETAFIESQHTIAKRIADLNGYSVESSKIFITRSETSLVLRDN